MSIRNISFEELLQGIDLPTGVRHKLILNRIKADIIEIDGLCFGSGSAVLLPRLLTEQADPSVPSGTVPSSRAGANAPQHASVDHARAVAPLIAVAEAFRYAEAHPDRKLLVVGHAANSTNNLWLSEMRAQNLYCLMKGDRVGWARACVQHTVRDLQIILDWAARVHAYGCQPGPVDGVMGPRTQAARDRFRRVYNFEMAGQLTTGTDWAEEDWKAVYNLHEVNLERYLALPEFGLGPKRALIQFKNPPTLACGEHWPTGRAAMTNLRSVSDNRVDLVFMEDKPHRDLAEQQPPAHDFYGHDLKFNRVVHEIVPDVLELRLLSPDGHPVPEIPYRLLLADGSVRDGQLNHEGNAIERHVPDGFFEVEWKELDAIRVRALAARLRYGLEPPIDWGAVHMVLEQSRETIAAVEQAYRTYYNTLGRHGMREDLYAAANSKPHDLAIDHLIAAARLDELKPKSNAQAIAWTPAALGNGAQADVGEEPIGAGTALA